MYEIESNIPMPEEPEVAQIQNDEFYGATPEQKRMYLKQRQCLPLSIKVDLTKRRIVEWYESHDGRVYVSFSGGKDSMVLLSIVRSIYPDVVAVFSDTGLEYPEVRNFVKTIDNVIWLKPKKNFTQVIEEYGYPVISKDVSMSVQRYRNTKFELQKELRLNGGFNPNTGRIQTQGVIPKKYRHLIDAPFKISEKCCDFLKKQPFKKFNKESGLVPFTGVMASDSNKREIEYYRTGCNSFNQADPQSKPMAFWTEQDVLECMYKDWIKYPSVYGEVIIENNLYKTTGLARTGCCFCTFGIMTESQPNRFQRMKLSHPDLWDYCINKLNLKQVLDYIGVPYE